MTEAVNERAETMGRPLPAQERQMRAARVSQLQQGSREREDAYRRIAEGAPKGGLITVDAPLGKVTIYGV